MLVQRRTHEPPSHGCVGRALSSAVSTMSTILFALSEGPTCTFRQCIQPRSTQSRTTQSRTTVGSQRIAESRLHRQERKATHRPRQATSPALLCDPPSRPVTASFVRRQKWDIPLFLVFIPLLIKVASARLDYRGEIPVNIVHCTRTGSVGIDAQLVVRQDRRRQARGCRVR